MAMFGSDFLRTKTEWLYPTQPMQRLMRAVLFFIALFLFYNILQGVVGAALFHWMYGGSFAGLATQGPDGLAQLMKAGLIGILPCALLTISLALWVARFGLPQTGGRLPFQPVKLGWLGWPILILAFIALSLLSFQGVFYVLGIDPATYSPTAGGLADKNSAAGLVEKAMADLAGDPKLFALVTLSAVIGAPVVEEILFRGALFAAIVQSPLGRGGAVLITSALFGLAHAATDGWPVVAVLFIMGLTLGVLLLRFGSLWVTIACHASWNALQSLALLSIGTQT